jgi:hypothetical protein
MATPKEIRKAIAEGKPVRVRFPAAHEEAVLTIVRTFGRIFYTTDGGAYDRLGAEILPAKEG